MFPSSPFTDTHLDSSTNHRHSHHHETRNPHANVTPEERFERLCMFLEAQFGSSISPIAKPKLPERATLPKPTVDSDEAKVEAKEDDDMEESDESLSHLEAEEMERLHAIGIPVPGLEVRVEKHVAKIWLETLEVECSYGVLRDRVKAVVERAVETVAPLWGQTQQ